MILDTTKLPIKFATNDFPIMLDHQQKIPRNPGPGHASDRSEGGKRSILLPDPRFATLRTMKWSLPDGLQEAGAHASQKQFPVKMRKAMIAGLAALVTSLSPMQKADADLILGDEAGGIGYNESTDYVLIPFFIINDNNGTQYTEYLLNALAPGIQDIYDFGQHSETNLSDFIASTTDGKDNFKISLDSSGGYVNGGDAWGISLQSDGTVRVAPQDPTPGEYFPWVDNNPDAGNNTATGFLQIYSGLLDSNGDASDYSFGDLSSGDMQLANSLNLYSTDFGGNAGVATTSIGGNRYDDSTYLQGSVIPEPSTITALTYGHPGFRLSASNRSLTVGLRIERGYDLGGTTWQVMTNLPADVTTWTDDTATTGGWQVLFYRLAQ